MVTFAFEDFVFDDVRNELTQAGTLLRVDAQILELLSYLLKHPHRIIPKAELIENVWQGRVLGDNSVSVCIAKLRKALGGRSNHCIGNVYGRGYRFLSRVRVIKPEPRAGQHELRSSAALTTDVSPFVGRSAPLMRLRAALQRASSGRGGACALLGEAGIGKSRTAEVLESHALEAGFLVSWGRCHALGNAPPLWPWLQVVRSCEGQLPSQLVSQLFVRLVRGDAACSSDYGAPDDAARSRSGLDLQWNAWHETLGWISAVTTEVSGLQPWLIVLEDVQWADAATLELLAHVIAEACQRRLLLVLTARDSEPPNDPRCRQALDYVLGHRDCERIALARLVEADIDAYTARLFGSSDGALTHAVFSKCEGNPFFMVELLRPWIDRPAPVASELTLSGYSLDIVRQALWRLDARAREVLSTASVVGRSFDLGLLASLTEGTGEQLIEILEDAMTSHVIVAARDSLTQFAFGHDLIRQVLYSELPSIRRVQLHRRIADVLEQRHSEVSPAELAHHLLSALPSGDVEKAIAAARRAVAAAARVGAYADACVFLRRALEALRLQRHGNPKLTCRLLHDLAQCERAAGEPSFADHFQQAVKLALEHGYAEILLAAGQRMSGGPGVIPMPETLRVLEAARHALPVSDHRGRAVVLAHLAWTMPYCQNAARVEDLLQQAEKLAEGSTDTAKRSVLRARLYFAGGPDGNEPAAMFAAQLEELAAARDPKEHAMWMLEPQLGRLIALLQRGKFSQAQRALETFRAAGDELHHAELNWHYERLRVVLRMNAGDFDYARRRLPELKREAERLKLHGRRAMEAIDWAEFLRQTTDIKPFTSQFARGLAADESDNPTVKATKLRTMVGLGMLNEARVGLRAISPSELSQLPKSRDYLATLAHFAVAAVATSQLDHAEVLYRLLEPYPGFCVAAVSCHCHGAVSHFLGILARALGDGDCARGHFEQALAFEERLGLLPRLARTQLELGSMLIAAADPHQRKQGRATLKLARATADRLGLQPVRDAAARLLERTTAGP